MWTRSHEIAIAALVIGVLPFLATILAPRGASAVQEAALAQTTRRVDPRWSLNQQVRVVVWPPSAQVNPTELRHLQLLVAVLNSQGRPVGVQNRLRLGIGIHAEGRRQEGPALNSTIPRYRVVLKRQDFMWLLPDHLYGIRVSPSEIFPELAKPGDYVLSFQYANPFRVDMGKGQLPFLGHTESAIVHIRVSTR